MAAQGLNVEGWSNLYKEKKSKMSKAVVKDRTVFKTTNAERTCLEPAGVQDEINVLVKKYDNGRAFVRPSGTEDVVRVYSEASTQADADKLNDDITEVVMRLA